jgi:hypothetical protein
MSLSILKLRFNRWVWLSLILATVWIMLACLQMWWQPILADEWDFYRAMIDWQHQRTLIPHPQAYIHLAQLGMSIFGQSIGSARLVGVLSAILSVWLIPLLVHFFWRDDAQRDWITIVAILIVALNPMTTQNAMLLDIDNTLLVPVLMILAIVWAALQPSSPRLRIAGLAIATAIALWVKLPTPPLLLSAFGLYHLLQREWRRAGEIIFASILGLVLFGITFTIYSLFSGYQWAFFAPTFARTSGFLNLSDLLVRFPQGVGVFVLWMSLPLSILLGIVLWMSVGRFVANTSNAPDALVLYVSIVALFYPLVYIPAWGYPRYQAPIIPVISILVSALIIRNVQPISPKLGWWFVALFVAILIFNFVILPDPLKPVYGITFEGGISDLARRMMIGLQILAFLSVTILSAVVLAAILARVYPISFFSLAITGLAIVTVAGSMSLSWTQVNATYSTRYRYTYAYADFFWSVQQAQSFGASTYSLAIKDVLFESGVPGDEIWSYLCGDCSPSLLDVIRTRRVDTLIWTTKESSRSSVLQDQFVIDTLRRCYSEETRGVFKVYRNDMGEVCR